MLPAACQWCGERIAVDYRSPVMRTGTAVYHPHCWQWMLDNLTFARDNGGRMVVTGRRP